MKKLILKYGLILFIILGVFKSLEFQFFSSNLSLEIYIAIISTIFLVSGFMLAKYWTVKSSTAKSKGDNKYSLDLDELSKFSKREQDVMQLLCHGYANKEIAQSLNISINTVKTHVSKVFSKLDVHNRTEALAEAKLLNIVH